VLAPVALDRPVPGELDAVLFVDDVVEGDDLDRSCRSGGEDRDPVSVRKAARRGEPGQPRRDEPRGGAGRERVDPVRRGHHPAAVEAPVAGDLLERLEYLWLLVLAGNALPAEPRVDTEALGLVRRDGGPG